MSTLLFYKNVGISSQRIGNSSQNQRNISPMFMGGTTSLQDAQGKMATSLQATELTLDEKKSHLVTDIASSEAFSSSVQSHLKQAEFLTQSKTAFLNDSI